MVTMVKADELQLADDPRSIYEPVRFNRLRVMIEEEAIKPTWGCPLYIAARAGGWLTTEQRMAGDKYQQITIDYNRTQKEDPDEAIPEARDLIAKRTALFKRRRNDAVDVLAGCRSMVDRLVLEECKLTTEREKKAAKAGLQLLSDFFNKGTKRERQK
jgi:hypothetical protein